MKALLVSFFNSNNLGDILIGEELYNMVTEHFVVEKYSYSDEINNKRENHLENSGLSKTSKWKSIVHRMMKHAAFRKLLFLYYTYIKKKNLDKYETKIANSDLLIIGGGNMIFDLDSHSSSSSQFNQFVEIAKRKKKKVFAISLGIGPFQTKQQAKNAIKSLGKCDYITFRDQSSYDIFRKYNNTHKNVKVAIDPVFLMSQEENKKNAIDKKIGLNILNGKLINQTNLQYEETIKSYIKLTNELLNKTSDKIVLFSTEIADYNAVMDVYGEFKLNDRVEYCYISAPSELLELYGTLKILIGTRMHSMIIALTQRIPIIGISWQQKVDSLFEICNDSNSVFKYEMLGDSVQKIVESFKQKDLNLEIEKEKINYILEKTAKKNAINIIFLNSLKEEIIKD